MSSRSARRDLQAGELCEDAVAHERAHTHCAIVGTGDGVSDTRVDPPDAKCVGQADAALELRRLTEERHQAAGFAADRGHLVHHAARRPDDQVFHLLAAHRPQPGLDVQRPRGEDRLHRGRLDRRRRADALAFRDVGLDQDGGAVLKASGMLARQHMEHAGNIRRPVSARIRGEPGAHLLVRAFPVGDQIQRHVTAPRVPLRADRDDEDAPLAPRTQRDSCGLPNRPLQDERSRIIGNAPHDIQPAWRARDEDGSLIVVGSVSQHAVFDAGGNRIRKPREVGNVVRDPRRGMQPTCHAIRPRRFSARCRCGSTVARNRSLAKPIQVTSDATSSGAAS